MKAHHDVYFLYSRRSLSTVTANVRLIYTLEKFIRAQSINSLMERMKIEDTDLKIKNYFKFVHTKRYMFIIYQENTRAPFSSLCL